MGITVTDPGIMAILFLKREEHHEWARTLFEQLVTETELNLQQYVEQEDFIVYGNEEKNYWLDWVVIHNVIVMRLFLAKDGECTIAAWQDLRKAVDSSIGSVNSQYSREGLIGTSLMYWGSFDPETANTITSSQITEWMGINRGALISSFLEYGILWRLSAWRDPPLFMEYAFLCSLPLVERAKTEFLFARNIGCFLRLELHLHQAYDKIATYEKMRESLLDLAGTLENDSTTILNLLKVGALDSKDQALQQVSATYGQFIRMMSRVYKLTAGLRANVERYKWHLGRIPKKSAHSAEADLEQFQLRISQMELDLEYCESTARGVQTSISLLGAHFEASRARREGLIVIALGIFGALIAVVGIVGQMTSDWRIITVSIAGVVGFGLVVWLSWHLFKKVKRRLNRKIDRKVADS